MSASHAFGRTTLVALPFLAGALALLSSLASCATSIDVGHQETADAALPPSGPVFVAADAGDAGDAEPIDAASLLQCVARECPWPWLTCAGSDGTLPTYACSTNVASDKLNCGGCNVQCPNGNPAFNLTPACDKGVCKLDCSPGSVDCNGIPDDGCEVHPFTDPANCGACGNQCATGVECINGTCGCPPGQTDCDGTCTDLATDDNSCGKCGFSCRDNPPDGGATPPNMIYGCKAGQCTDLHCTKDVGQDWTDCNKSIHPDGCEVNLAQADPNNCGACGTTCDANQRCFAFGSAGIACQCPANTTYCPGVFRGNPQTCADFSNDPNNCGSCGYTCPFVANATPTCDHGSCSFKCNDGQGNCDGTAGCETSLLNDPHNCGACGNTCDVGQGQPCIDGVCATAACDAGVTK